MGKFQAYDSITKTQFEDSLLQSDHCTYFVSKLSGHFQASNHIFGQFVMPFMVLDEPYKSLAMPGDSNEVNIVVF